MAQKKNYATDQPDPQVLQQGLPEALKQATQDGTPALPTFAQLQGRRAARVQEVAKALQAKLGKDHPEVMAMTDLVNRVMASKTDLAARAAPMGRWPSPCSNEWLVRGTVADLQGKPAAGMIVRVFDRDRKLDALLGETTTDESGGFAISYPEKLFKEVGQELPDFYIMVSDARGNTLYTSRQPVRYAAGRSEYFAIGLGKKAGT